MFYRFVLTLARIVMSICFEVRFVGQENIPKDSGFILAANHRTLLDPVFCASGVDRNFSFMAKQELFENRIFGAFIRSLGAFPVARGAGARGAIKEAEKRLDEGGALMMFIEGTRSKDGIPLRPRSGVALIAGETGAQVVPCTVDFGKKLRFRTPIRIRYHKPMTVEELGIDTDSPASLRNATRTIMDEIVGGLTYLPQPKETKDK